MITLDLEYCLVVYSVTWQEVHQAKMINQLELSSFRRDLND